MVTWWDNLTPADRESWCEAAMRRQASGLLASTLPPYRYMDWLTLLTTTSWDDVGNADQMFGLHDDLISVINDNC